MYGIGVITSPLKMECKLSHVLKCKFNWTIRCADVQRANEIFVRRKRFFVIILFIIHTNIMRMIKLRRLLLRDMVVNVSSNIAVLLTECIYLFRKLRTPDSAFGPVEQ